VPPAFRLGVEPHPDVVILHASGLLDADAVDLLDRCIASLWSVGLRRISVDVHGVRASDPAVEHLIDSWARRAAREQGRFDVWPQPPVAWPRSTATSSSRAPGSSSA
jgi:hypothetical protein